MSNKIAKNDKIITKKCGEITITIKKNTKHVFSFNCWFCDTICAQLKKFTLHLEKEHVEELEQTTSALLPEFCNPNELDDKINVQNEPVVDSLFLAEIKIEDCGREDIKTEIGEEISQNVTRPPYKEQQPQKYDDLETVECNGNDISMAEQEENKTDMQLKKELQFDDAENDNISEYDHFEDDSDYGGVYLPSTRTSLKPNKSDKKAKEKELILALIEEYRNKPELWNISSEKKLTSKEKDEILKNIAVDLNEKFNTKLKLYTVKTKLNNICKQFEEVIRKQMSVHDEEKMDESEGSDLWYYQQLSFLKPTIENKIKNQEIKPDHEELFTMTKPKPDFLKENVLKDLQEAVSYRNIAKKYNISIGLISKIKKQNNLCVEGHKNGRPKKLSVCNAREVKRLIMTGAAQNSVEVKKIFQERYNLNISSKTIRRSIKSDGFVGKTAKRHVEELEQTTPVILPEIDVQNEPVVNSLFLGEIKIEDCETEDIKTEVGEEREQKKMKQICN